MVLVSSKPIVLVGLIVMVMHFLHAGQEHETLPCMEKHMTTLDWPNLRFKPPPAHVGFQGRRFEDGVN